MLDVAARSIGAPVVAIGGISRERQAEAAAAGADGVAVLSGIWSATKPAAAVEAYLDALALERSSNGDTDDDSRHHQR